MASAGPLVERNRIGGQGPTPKHGPQSIGVRPPAPAPRNSHPAREADAQPTRCVRGRHLAAPHARCARRGQAGGANAPALTPLYAKRPRSGGARRPGPRQSASGAHAPTSRRYEDRPANAPRPQVRGRPPRHATVGRTARNWFRPARHLGAGPSKAKKALHFHWLARTRRALEAAQAQWWKWCHRQAAQLATRCQGLLAHRWALGAQGSPGCSSTSPSRPHVQAPIATGHRSVGTDPQPPQGSGLSPGALPEHSRGIPIQGAMMHPHRGG